MTAKVLFDALAAQLYFGFAAREAMLKDDAVALAATQLVVALAKHGVGRDDKDVAVVVAEAKAGKVPENRWPCPNTDCTRTAHFDDACEPKKGGAS